MDINVSEMIQEVVDGKDPDDVMQVTEGYTIKLILTKLTTISFAAKNLARDLDSTLKIIDFDLRKGNIEKAEAMVEEAKSSVSNMESILNEFTRKFGQ